jgi:hypothetical protein
MPGAGNRLWAYTNRAQSTWALSRQGAMISESISSIEHPASMASSISLCSWRIPASLGI